MGILVYKFIYLIYLKKSIWSEIFLVCKNTVISLDFGLPGDYNTIPPHKKLNFRKSCRKVGITTTQHRLNFAEKSQRQKWTHRTFSAKILKPTPILMQSGGPKPIASGKMPKLHNDRCALFGNCAMAEIFQPCIGLILVRHTFFQPEFNK